MPKVRFVKSYPLFLLLRSYPLSTCCVVLIWVLSLTPWFPETPLSDVSFIDKYTHFIMYGGTAAVMWCEHLWHCRQQARRANLRALWLYGFMGLVALGGLMELLQAYATTTRSGEWLDFWADALGALLGCGLSNLVYHINAR